MSGSAGSAGSGGALSLASTVESFAALSVLSVESGVSTPGREVTESGTATGTGGETAMVESMVVVSAADGRPGSCSSAAVPSAPVNSNRIAVARQGKNHPFPFPRAAGGIVFFIGS